jgi:pectinesterase
MVSLAALAGLLAVSGLAAPANVTVAVDGTGQYRTIQLAVDAAPAFAQQRFVIQVKPGIYLARIVVPREKCLISLVGEDAEQTVLTYDTHANMLGGDGQPVGTFRTASTAIEADDFEAENITFENPAGTNGQALAIRVSGDRAVFRKCRFVGWQDTVLVQSGRQYFEQCYVAGHVDFIFGGATAFFESCQIHCRRSGYITAAATPEQQPFGFVFSNCKITAASPEVKTYLGRPWRPFASVIFLNTEMSDAVRPVGWHNWGQPSRENTARYAEFHSTGPGANPSARVSWAKPLSEEEAKSITLEKVLGGMDGWNPKTGETRSAVSVIAPSTRAQTLTRAGARGDGPVYLFTSFRNNGEDGLHLAYSYDGYRWTDLGRSFLAPTVGTNRLMRDPSLLRGPNGLFHLVWTTSWRGDKGFGYAQSKDLIHWSEQRFIEVMAREPTAVNVRAPELFYDETGQRFIISWSSTIPGRYPNYLEATNQNDRLYYTTTRDFGTFTPTKLFFEPGFSVTDGSLVQDGTRYVLVHKDNSRPMLNLRVAFANNLLGPYGPASAPFTEMFTEGPSVLRVGNDWLVYFDGYGENRYGAVKTRDFRTFIDVTSEVSFPADHRHGTALSVSPEIIEGLLQAAPPARTKTSSGQ